MSSSISSIMPLLSSHNKNDRPINPQPSSLLFRLPVELRLSILEHALPATKTRTLYMNRSIWTWSNERPWRDDPKRQFLKILLVCRGLYDEAIDILYSRHELSLYWALQPRENVRVGFCGIEDYVYVFQRVQRLKLTLFVTGKLHQDNVLIALLAWLKIVVAERQRPMKLLTLEFCAINWKLDCRPTAILYAAQGFRSLCPTEFNFQCGFSGVGNESAVEALTQHASEKTDRPSRTISREEAFEAFLKAWKNSRPRSNVSKMLSNRWFKTTFDA